MSLAAQTYSLKAKYVSFSNTNQETVGSGIPDTKVTLDTTNRILTIYSDDIQVIHYEIDKTRVEPTGNVVTIGMARDAHDNRLALIIDINSTKTIFTFAMSYGAYNYAYVCDRGY